MATLHIHLDESGNFVFSPKGTRFYIFTAAWTHNPLPLATALSDLRFSLIKAGEFRPNTIDDLSHFHACDDPAPRRDAFVEKIMQFQDWNFASIVIEKNRINPAFYDQDKFYPTFLSIVLRFVLKGKVRPSTKQVLIYTDTLPMKSKKDSAAVNTTIKASCKKDLNGTPFRILHHCAESNYWIQVADYCSWAMNRKWQHGETEIYERLRPRLAKTELVITDSGDGTIYYRLG